MENDNLAQPPKDFEEIVKRVREEQKTNRHGAIRYIWQRVSGTSPPPEQSIEDMVSTQQKLKQVATGGMSKTYEDYTAGALNALQMRNITQALGGGGGGSNLDDKFDKVLLMRMMSPQNEGMQIMLAMLPLMMGGNRDQALEKVISEVKTMVEKTDSQWKELFNESQNRLWQRQVQDDQSSRDETMRAFIRELHESNERIVGSLAAQLENLRPLDTNTQVQGALEVLTSYQSFLKTAKETLQGFGLSPEQAGQATEEATAPTAKNYLMTSLGNFLGGLGNTLLGGGGPPLPPGYINAPNQPFYYQAPAAPIPQPTFGYEQSQQPAQPPIYYEASPGQVVPLPQQPAQQPAPEIPVGGPPITPSPQTPAAGEPGNGGPPRPTFGQPRQEE